MGDLSKDFNRYEFACACGCGFDTVDSELVRILQDIRDHFDSWIAITSGCRCPAYNLSCGGASQSQHKTARAADFKVGGVPPSVVQDYVREHHGCSMGSYATFTHIDTRTDGPLLAYWEG